RSSGIDVKSDEIFLQRSLVKKGNRDLTGADFGWYLRKYVTEESYPVSALVLERREWGNFYGFLREVKEQGAVVADANVDEAVMYEALEQRLQRAKALFGDIHQVEKGEIGDINYGLEKLRLRERRLQLEQADLSPQAITIEKDAIAAKRARLEAEYAGLQQKLETLYTQINRDSITVAAADGRVLEIPIAKIVRVYRPNAMGLFEKIGFYFAKLAEFFTDDPREANTEGGIFPAIFGTVVMVLIMSVIVTPF